MLKQYMMRCISAAGLLALTACTAPTPNKTVEAETSPTPIVTPVTIQEDTVAHGQFSGLSDHITKGDTYITGTPGAYTLVFGGNFSLDGAPDPIVGFGSDGTFDPSTKLGSLSQTKGAQSYTLPASFSLDSVNEVYVWCERFDVPLGVATFTPNATPKSDG